MMLVAADEEAALEEGAEEAAVATVEAGTRVEMDNHNMPLTEGAAMKREVSELAMPVWIHRRA